MKKFFNTVTLPYLVYLMYFLGVGFLSGAIVHYPVNPTLYGTIGIAGMVIFTIASTLNEWLTNKRHLLHGGVMKIIVFSLILSIGLGMISGGIQHFVDFPMYASYLIPLGFVVSLVGYILSKEIKLDTNHKLILIAKLALIAIPLFFILNTWAKTLPEAAGDHGHGAEAESNSHLKKTIQIKHTEIKNDEQFIIEMIPHHQKAIDTSQYVNKETSNPEIKEFAKAVIQVQTIEVTQMRQWYTSWFGKDYSTNMNYIPMMGNLTTYEGAELEKEYIKGMIAHHSGAIAMAKQIQPVTKRPEIQKMADTIINVQSEEVKMLQNMLENYEHDESEHTPH